MIKYFMTIFHMHKDILLVYGNLTDYSGSEVGDDEIEAMLEEGLPDNLRGKLGDDSRYEDSYKTVLEGI